MTVRSLRFRAMSRVDNEPAPGIFLRYIKSQTFHRAVDDE